MHLAHAIFSAAMLIAIYAFADRFAGGGAPKLDSELPGRAAVWGCAAAAVVGFFVTGGWIGFWFALAWLGWRTPAWKQVPHASTTPVTPLEVAATYLRHSFATALVMIVAWIMHLPLGRTAWIFAVWALFATLLGRAYGDFKQHAEPGEPDPNWIIELARGAVFGASVALATAV